MDFEERLYEVILERVEGREIPPDAYTIEKGEYSVWKAGVTGEILITARWYEEADEEDELDMGRWNKEFVSLGEGDPLFDELQIVFTEIEGRISMLDDETEIDAFSWSVNNYQEPSEETDISYEWTGDGQLPYNAFVGIAREEQYSETGLELLGKICDTLSNNYNDTVTTHSIIKAEVLFSDFHYCKPHLIRVEFETRNPHNYYEEVSSVEEYVEVLSDSEDEVQELLNQVTYEVNIPLRLDAEEDGDWSIEDSLTNLQTAAKDLMQARIDTMVTVDGPYSYESEAIIFEDGVEYTKFYLRPYFTVAENP